MSNHAQWQNSRAVRERIFITGELVLKTPASFGNGDAEGTTDIPLLLDPLDGRSPLLTGASIAGALRNYLRAYQNGHGWEEQRQSARKSQAEQLFGHLDDAFIDESGKRKKSAVESWLMVDDALGKFANGRARTELRDGVAIDPTTRTVEEDERGGHKFDMELLPAGTTFRLSFEFWKTTPEDDLLATLAAALKGFQDGKIQMGMRKQRGLGECAVTGWQVCRYPMNTPEGLLGWLKRDTSRQVSGADIAGLLGVPLAEDQSQAFTIDAWFGLRGSILIRSEGGEDDVADMTQLKSWRDGGLQPILPGTSLGGVLRGRALRIANTMLGPENGQRLVDDCFGQRIRSAQDQPTSSQVRVSETVIENGAGDQVQSRVKIDRFTGGAYPQALFTQQPLWAGPDEKQIHIQLELRRYHNGPEADFQAKAGLLLLALKDLWTGDLAVGGESSVGRGRLQGVQAVVTMNDQTWEIHQQAGRLAVEGDPRPLETFVKQFLTWQAPKEGQVNHG